MIRAGGNREVPPVGVANKPSQEAQNIYREAQNTHNRDQSKYVARGAANEYPRLSDREKVQMQSVKDAGREFFNLVDGLGTSREVSLAKTKIEEAVMWATKHITR